MSRRCHSMLLLLLPLLSAACEDGDRVRTGNNLVHRCKKSSGVWQWEREAACWLNRSAEDPEFPGVVELEFDEFYNDTSGQPVAQCRKVSGSVALVLHRCELNETVRLPGDVWLGAGGNNYTCVPASGSDNAQSVLLGCPPLSPNATEGVLQPPGSIDYGGDGLVYRCAINRKRRFGWAEKTGCWLKGQNGSVLLLKPEERTPQAVCQKRWGTELALSVRWCRAMGQWHRPGSAWRNAKGEEEECVPAESEFGASATIVLRACRTNSTSIPLAPPNSTRDRSDGSVRLCSFRWGRYDWFEPVGCWSADSEWLAVNKGEPVRLTIGEEMRVDNQTIGLCVKRRYRDQVALLPQVCLTGFGWVPLWHNWTMSNGTAASCVPFQPDGFRAKGARVVPLACDSVPAGQEFLTSDGKTRLCEYSRYAGRYRLDQWTGCWLSDGAGGVLRLRVGKESRTSDGTVVLECRRGNYRGPKPVPRVCFFNGQTFLNWTQEVGLAKPGERRVDGNGDRLICGDSDGAAWRLFGCRHENSTAAPNATRRDADGVVSVCVRDGRNGEFKWRPVGCWLRDHRGEILEFNDFNEEFRHPSLANDSPPVAACTRRYRWRRPNLRLLACFQDGRVSFDGDVWSDADGLNKTCRMRESSGAVAIVNGCWASVTDSDNSTTRLLLGNGSVVAGNENRMLRCDFNARSGSFEWLTSVACWTVSETTGRRVKIPIGRQVRESKMLVAECVRTRNGDAFFLRHACRNGDTWMPAFSSWRSGRFKFFCREARRGYRSPTNAKAVKTHCLTDEGVAIDENKKVNGVQYVCMFICGFTIFMREPTPAQYRFLFSAINNCHAVNMNIIRNIG